MTCRIGVTALLLGLCLASGCHRARPIGYPFPPGISASFPPSQVMASAEFAKTFCSVMQEPDINTGHTWQGCDTYVEMSGSATAGTLEEIPAGWTILTVGGFGAECFYPKIKAFSDAAEHLTRKHPVGHRHLRVDGLGSSEHNAGQIRDAIKSFPTGEKYIAIAHSKGAVDMLVALDMYGGDLQSIKALVTVAGAIGGSHLVDKLIGLNEKILKSLHIEDQCAVNRLADNAIDSMRRDRRQEYLAKHEPLKTPAFSISAVATKDTISNALRGLWSSLRSYAQEQDSHILEREAVVPGGVFLGRAKGDHWAVAMPVHGNPEVKPKTLLLVNRNEWPRTALIEAAVREVVKRVPSR